ncbi:hypothetical protein DL767_006179 [Monosporascus sp. MG133]|nr:hypothetical protein DL767_006179 [Monosporascus sp. MG133]
MRGKVRAKEVVYATNSYTTALLPEFEGRIVPGTLEYDYLIPSADGSIVVGGARPKRLGDRESWYDSVEDDKLIGARRPASTVMGYQPDKLPDVGAVPGRQNQFMLAGFSGRDMPQASLAVRGFAAMVLRDESFGNNGIPKVFEATRERLSDPRNVVLEAWKANRVSGGL